MVLFSKALRRVSFLWVFVLLFAGCVKEERHPVPIIPVDFRINTEFQYIELNSIGGHVNVFGGYGGIVIYRLSFDEFTAFDRACPFDPFNEDARIVVEDPPLATCHVCGSTFLLLDGSPVSGPSRHPLLQYQTFYDEPYLYVSN